MELSLDFIQDPMEGNRQQLGTFGQDLRFKSILSESFTESAQHGNPRVSLVKARSRDRTVVMNHVLSLYLEAHQDRNGVQVF